MQLREKIVAGATLIEIMSQFWNDKSGATAIEYALLTAGIAQVIKSVVNGLGTTLIIRFTSIISSLR